MQLLIWLLKHPPGKTPVAGSTASRAPKQAA